jgi:predicted ribosomally synthesized peptide with SipW-like signal peptide
MMKKILLSAAIIVGIGGAAFVATNAFFSDTETSTGNTFTAGAIDLKIDNTSYGFDWNNPTVTSPTGVWGLNNANSWQSTDLTNQLFFSFTDLKPGDYGEDTISLLVNSNPAYACMAFDLTSTPDNGLTEPEVDADDETDGVDGGELQNYLSFLFWNDDGDNVLEVGETVIQELSGLPGSVFTGSWLPLAQSGNTPLPANTTQYIGKGWCFGAMTATPVAQDGVNTNPPSAPGRVGFTCSGAGDQNNAQTDGIVVDVGFYAVQSRNNEQFLCSGLPPFGGGEQLPLVGALSSSYDDPETAACTSIVGGAVGGLITHTSIQAAVNAAVDGNTVCVDPTYAGGDTFPVNVDKDLTIAGLGVMGAANIPGGFFISDSGVTVTGLEFTNYSFIQASENAAIYIHNEVGVSGVDLVNTTVDHNIFTAPAGAIAANAKGVITEIGSVAAQATGIDVLHNVFNGWNQAMFFNTAVDYEVAYNDILNNTVGIANDGPHNASIHNNDFEGNIAEAVGVAPSATNGTGNNGLALVNTNNLTPATAGNDVNWYGASVLGAEDVNAENNFWAGDADAARTNNTTEVDTNPFSAVAYPEN